MKIQTVKISGQGYAVDYGDGVIWSVSVDGCGYDKVLAWLSEGNIPEPEFTDEELAQQVIKAKEQEAKQYLQATDHKFYLGYKPKEGEDLATIEAKRDEAREYIRMNEVA